MSQSDQEWSAAEDLAAQRDERLLQMTRLLLACSTAGVLSIVLVAKYDPTPTSRISIASLTALSASYLVVLLLVHRGQRDRARTVLFSSWLLYGASVLALYRPFPDIPLMGDLLFSVATLFFAVSIVGSTVLGRPSRNHRWPIANVATFAITTAALGLTVIPSELTSTYAMMAGTTLGLLTVLTVGIETLERNLIDTLDRAEVQREHEHQLRLEATQARQEAEASRDAKARFLANMSHEIRTPMNSVLGMSELLLGGRLAPQQRQYARLVHDSGEKLLTLINDILDLSKIEAVGVELAPTSTDLRSLLSRLIDTQEQRARELGLALSLEVDPQVPQAVSVDANRLHQVVLNLVSNALKFTKQGWVRVRVKPVEAALRFEVEDTGLGMDASQLGRLFEAFSQADETITREFGGTGLGLTISQQIVHKMGGAIQVESRLGQGSRFWFEVELPAAEIEPEPEPAEQIAERLDSAFEGRILLVDDNLVNQQVGAAMSRRLGCEVALASSGREALGAVQEETFDLILMDCQMPVWDGFKTVSEIRAMWTTRDTETPPPVVALTAHATPGYREHCLANGMDDYLAKPLTLSALAAVFGRWGLASGRPAATPTPPPRVATDGILDAVLAALGPSLGRFVDYTELVRDGLADQGVEGEPVADLEAVLREATEMARLVRATRSLEQFTRIEVQVDHALAQVEASLRDHAATTGVQLQLGSAVDTVVRTDPARLHTALAGIVHTLIHLAAGQVEITCQPGQSVAFAIRAPGSTLAPDRLAALDLAEPHDASVPIALRLARAAVVPLRATWRVRAPEDGVVIQLTLPRS